MAVLRDPDGIETRVLHDLIDFAGLMVLEIGCGDGRLTWRYADQAASVLAIDPRAADIAAARAQTPDALRSRVAFAVADITSVDLPVAAFDVAILAWSL